MNSTDVNVAQLKQQFEIRFYSPLSIQMAVGIFIFYRPICLRLIQNNRLLNSWTDSHVRIRSKRS